jgi:uncharacterized protein (TIGR02453 family)
MQRFQGFDKEAIGFLKRLKKNNRREWFQPRKEEYEELLKTPMTLLVADLAECFRKTAPEIRFTPRSVLRIYRDTRFSKDKTPYKTHIAASFSMSGAHKTMDAPGLYVHVAPDEVFIGGGLYMPNPKQLTRIRYAIEQKSDQFLDLIENRSFKREFGGLQGDTLKRAPKGYLPDHPMIEHLKRKQFFVGRQLAVKDCMSPSFVKKVEDSYAKMLPLARWLRDNSY